MGDDRVVRLDPYRRDLPVIQEALVQHVCDTCKHRKGWVMEFWRCGAYGGRYTESICKYTLEDKECNRWSPRAQRRSLIRWLYDTLFRW